MIGMECTYVLQTASTGLNQIGDYTSVTFFGSRKFRIIRKVGHYEVQLRQGSHHHSCEDDFTSLVKTVTILM